MKTVKWSPSKCNNAFSYLPSLEAAVPAESGRLFLTLLFDSFEHAVVLVACDEDGEEVGQETVELKSWKPYAVNAVAMGLAASAGVVLEQSDLAALALACLPLCQDEYEVYLRA